MPDKNSQICLKIDDSMQHMRLDIAVATLLPEYSRSTLQQWLKQGRITVDERIVKAKYKLLGHETLRIDVPQPTIHQWQGQKMALDIVALDDDFIVINKPSGLVVHPGAGNADQTLLNGLLYEFAELASLPRAGIVHRLDKDTTGLMVVARTEMARQHFIAQLDSRQMHRQYAAVVNGMLVAGETINQPIGRHSRDRLKMAVSESGKTAITKIKVREKFRKHCLIQANLQTGRTHQIRVHMQFRGHALIGDGLYRGKTYVPSGASDELTQAIRHFPRQALHAEELAFIHPRTAHEVTFTQPIPDDMAQLIALLRTDYELAQDTH